MVEEEEGQEEEERRRGGSGGGCVSNRATNENNIAITIIVFLSNTDIPLPPAHCPTIQRFPCPMFNGS